MISSPSNPKIKFVRALAKKQTRQEKKQFVVEGVRLIEEAVRAGSVPALVFFTAALHGDRRARILLEKIGALTRELHQVSDAVMRALANTETPQGILAVVPFPQIPVPTRPDLLLILDSIRDPGNLGAILRSARAAGVAAIWLAPGTVDAYNAKVVRAAMGAHFSVSIRSEPWEKIAHSAQGIPRVYLADARGELEYTGADWTHPVALIVGGEAEGASAAAQKLATARVRIPMRNGAESLNAAMAATVLLFHAARESKTFVV